MMSDEIYETLDDVDTLSLAERRAFAFRLINRQAERMDARKCGRLTDSSLLAALQLVRCCWDVEYRIWFETSRSGAVIWWYGRDSGWLPQAAKRRLNNGN